MARLVLAAVLAGSLAAGACVSPETLDFDTTNTAGSGAPSASPSSAPVVESAETAASAAGPAPIPEEAAPPDPPDTPGPPQHEPQGQADTEVVGDTRRMRDSAPVAVSADDVRFDTTLRGFEDCKGLMAEIHAQAVRRVGPFGLDRSDEFVDEFLLAQTSVRRAQELIDEAIAVGIPRGVEAAQLVRRVARSAASLGADLVRSDVEDRTAVRWLFRESDTAFWMWDAAVELLIALENLERAEASGLDHEVAAAREAVDNAEALFEGSQAAVSGSEAAEAQPGGSTSGRTNFSQTNVQVQGVDEPDIIKTDGRRIVLVTDGLLKVVDITGASPTVAGVVAPRTAGPAEILLRGDRAFLISGVREASWSFDGESRVGNSVQTVFIDEVHLDGSPRRGRTLRIEGRFVDARVVDGTARIVVAAPRNRLEFSPPKNINLSDSLQAAEVRNRRAVTRSTAADWLPVYAVASFDGTFLSGGVVAPCDRVYVPTEFSGFGALAVVTVDLDESLDVDSGVALLASGETVYAEPDNLFVATNVSLPRTVRELPGIGERFGISIHKFSLPPGAPAVYEASGSVPGHLLNQFAMHHWDGHLFVTVTAGPPGSASHASESRLLALVQREGALEVVGEIGDLGRGEILAGVRYLADRAYVVTYRVVPLTSDSEPASLSRGRGALSVEIIDPLYVVDLADPTRPVLLGDLEVPGYSAYLHRIGDGLLVGVGADADEAGGLVDTRVSLFDVSDPAEPWEVDSWRARFSRSTVEFDHRSFLWWPAEGLMVVPVVSRASHRGGRAEVFRPSATEGLGYVGEISHGSGSQDAIERSLIVGDDLWTLSESLLQSNNLDTLEIGTRLDLQN